MDHKLKTKIKLSWLSQKLNLEFVGDDIDINNICSISNITDQGLAFAKEIDSILSLKPASAVIICSDITDKKDFSYLISQNPRFDFIRAMEIIEAETGFYYPDKPAIIDETAQVSPSAVIENDVIIGKGCVVGPNVVIRRGSKIGQFCHFQSGVVIGEDGFGYERDELNRPIKMVHLGGVEIANNVHIGSNTIVCQGTLSPTIIENDVKIDNLVHIAHNCHIQSRAMIIACAEISGGVTIGEDSWIAPNACVRQKISIGAESLVGLGAVVVKNVEDKAIVMGNPAKPLPQKK